MKLFSLVFKLAVLSVLFFYRIGAMPGTNELSTSTVVVSVPNAPKVKATPKYDKWVEVELAKLRGQPSIGSRQLSIDDMLAILNNILHYAGSQNLAAKTQIDYCEAVKNFDRYARAARSSLNKQDITAINIFLKKLEGSTLMYDGDKSYIAFSIQYWDNAVINYRMTPNQR